MNGHNTCYKGRLIKFWPSFLEASDHACKLRSQMPATYNEARVTEAPIPPVNVTDETNNESFEDEAHDAENVVPTAIVHETSGESSWVDEEEFATSQENALGGTSDESTEQVAYEVKLETVQVAELDMNALNATFLGDDDLAEAHSDNELNESGKNTITSHASNNTDPLKPQKCRVDDDVEYVFTSESDFCPMQVKDGYIIKPNDMLSCNWPLKENVW